MRSIGTMATARCCLPIENNFAFDQKEERGGQLEFKFTDGVTHMLLNVNTSNCLVIRLWILWKGQTPTNVKFLMLFFAWGTDYGRAVESIPAMCTQLNAVVKHMNAVFQQEKVRCILQNIRGDYERLMSHPEYKVLQRHGMEGRKYVVSFLGVMVPLALVYFTVSFVLIISDTASKNATEDKYLMYEMHYYFFDAQEHYSFTTTHCIIASVVALVQLISMDVMYITLIQHACALYAVTGYRLKTVHILNMDILNNDEDIAKYKNEEISTWQQEEMYKRLVNCVREHKIAIQYTKLVQSAYGKTLFFQLSIAMLCLSISGVLVLMKKSNPTDVLRLGIWIMGQLVHLFFLCLPGQRLMNFSQQVYFDALDCTWYLLHTKSRVIYQFIVMNTLTPVTLTALKVTTLNLETFLTVLQTAMSYFTVVSSAF